MLIPYRYLQELAEKGLVSLSPESKNTIDGLISEDMERAKPKELKLKHLPMDFWYKNKYGQNMGPSVGELNGELKFK